MKTLIFILLAIPCFSQAKKDSTEYWFNKKIRTEHTRDSVKKAQVKKQPAVKTKKVQKPKTS